MNRTLDAPQYSIQCLPEEERPRERFLRHGAESLTNAELIAIILGSGMKGTPILQLAQQIIAHFGDMQALANATIPELCAIKGLGPAKALQLKAAVNLGMRFSRKALPVKYRIDQPVHAYNLIKDELEGEQRELFMVILQDAKNHLISTQIVSIGALSEAQINPREVFYSAIRHNASSLILAHNHPSGDPTPSKEDVELTEALINAGKLMGISINDHLIIGHQNYSSLRQLGVKF